MKKFIDLSHTVEHGQVTYQGLPAPMICDFLSREESKSHYSGDTSFNIGKIEMVANTGTYLDSPFHRFEDGADLSELPLSSIAELNGVLVEVDPGVSAIDESFFRDLDVTGKAVLVKTNWSKLWGSEDYFHDHPYLTKAAAEYLVKQDVRLVGIDSYNIDDVSDGYRPVHTALLGSNIPIVEHMCGLAGLPPQEFSFSAVPAKVKAFGTFPVRAYASFDSRK